MEGFSKLSGERLGLLRVGWELLVVTTELSKSGLVYLYIYIYILPTRAWDRYTPPEEKEFDMYLFGVSGEGDGRSRRGPATIRRGPREVWMLAWAQLLCDGWLQSLWATWLASS